MSGQDYWHCVACGARGFGGLAMWGRHAKTCVEYVAEKRAWNEPLLEDELRAMYGMSLKEIDKYTSDLLNSRIDAYRKELEKL